MDFVQLTSDKLAYSPTHGAKKQTKKRIDIAPVLYLSWAGSASEPNQKDGLMDSLPLHTPPPTSPPPPPWDILCVRFVTSATLWFGFAWEIACNHGYIYFSGNRVIAMLQSINLTPAISKELVRVACE